MAQTPSWSRGIQKLSVSEDECKSRARHALQAEGYTIENQGGGDSGDYYFGGYKEIHNAVIACNSSADGKMWANVFVASCLSRRNSEISGAEREKLQGRMDRPGTDGGSVSLPGRWCREGNANLPTSISQAGNSLTFTNEGGAKSKGYFENSSTVIASDWEGGLRGMISSDRTRIDWANGTSWRRCGE